MKLWEVIYADSLDRLLRDESITTPEAISEALALADRANTAADDHWAKIVGKAYGVEVT